MKTSSSMPDICDFLSIRDYLTEYYLYRKNNSNGFSYEIWAQELGIKSRSFLRMVVMGQRPITKDFAETLSYGLRLSPQDLKYFFLLLEYSRAKTKEQKQYYWRQMLVLLKSRDPRTEISATEFISSHWLPKIQTLLGFKDIQKTTKNISDLLGLDEATALQCLEKLEALSVVQKNTENSQEGSWATHLSRFKVPEAIQNAALKEYYIQSFDDAKAAIALPAEVRKFRSLLVPLNPEEYEKLLEILEEAFQEILLQYKSDELQGRSLYQMGMSLFPITKNPETENTQSRQNQNFNQN